MSSLLLDVASSGQILFNHGGLYHFVILFLAFARTTVAQDDGDFKEPASTTFASPDEDPINTPTATNTQDISNDPLPETVTHTVTSTVAPQATTNKGTLHVTIALGVLLIIVLIAIGIFFYLQRRRKIMAKRRRKYQVGSPFNFQESAWGYPGAEAWFKSQGAMLTPHQRTMIMSSPFMTNNYAGQIGQMGQMAQIGQMIQSGPHQESQGNRASMYPTHYDPAKMLIQGPSTAAAPTVVGYPKPVYNPAQYQTVRPRPETSPPMLGTMKFPHQLLNPTIQGRASAHGAIELEGSGDMPPMLRAFSPPLMSPCQYHSADDVCAPPAPPPKSPMYLRPSPAVRRLSGLGINTNIKERSASEKSVNNYPTDVPTLVPDVTVTRSSMVIEAPNTSHSCPSYLPSYTSQEAASGDAAFPPAEYLTPNISETALPTAGSSQEASTNDENAEESIASHSRATFGFPKKKRKPPRLANFAEIVIPPGQSPPLSPVVFRLDASPTDAPLESPDTIPSPHSAKSQSSVRSWFKFGKGKAVKTNYYHNKFSFQSQSSDTTYIENSVALSDAEKGKLDPYDTDVSENFPYGDERYYRTALKTAPLQKSPDMGASESSTQRNKPKKKRSLREQIVSLPTSVATMYVKDGKVIVRPPEDKNHNDQYMF